MSGLSIKCTEIFVGRKKEIDSFYDFLKNKGHPAMVIVAETGIGKSTFLGEIVKRLRRDSTSTGVFVGFEEVLDGTTNVASPFVGVIDDLMKNMEVPLREKVEETRDRAVSAFKKILSEKGKKLCKSLVKSIALKWLSQDQIDEIQNAIEEFQKTESIESIAEEKFSKYRDEFVQDLIFFFETLTQEYKTLEFVLVIDQFERAPLPSYYVLLSLIRARIERLNIVVSIKVQEKGMEKFNSIKPELHQLDTQFLTLNPFSYRVIGDWILKARGKEFSDPQLRRISWLSGGFPFLIAAWLKHSQNLELSELKVRREGYCRFIEWCFKGLSDKYRLFLRRISVLSQPLSVSDYERLTSTKTGECSILLEKLEKNWILIRQKDSFWFRHDLIKPCVEGKLSPGEKHQYHLDAAKFFEAYIDYQERKKQSVEFQLVLCCAYHFHFAGEYQKSVYYSEIASHHSYNIGDLDVAEICYLRTMEAAKKIGDAVTSAVAKGNLARVYRVWGRLDESHKICEELCNYFHKIKNPFRESKALYQLGLTKQLQGNLEEAKKLYNQSLKIKQELGNKLGIAQSTHQLGRINQDQGNLEEAKKLYNQSLKIKQELGNKLGIARSTNQLGIIERLQGNLEEAKKLYNQSLKIKQELGNKLGIANSLHELGIILEQKNQLEKGLKHFIKAGNLFSIIGSIKEKSSIKSVSEIIKKMDKKRIQNVLEGVSNEEKAYLNNILSQLD